MSGHGAVWTCAKTGPTPRAGQPTPRQVIDPKRYRADVRDILLSVVLPEDFGADLDAGDGNGLATKFRVAHPSWGVVNCFAPPCPRRGDLGLPGGVLALCRDPQGVEDAGYFPEMIRWTEAPDSYLSLSAAVSNRSGTLHPDLFRGAGHFHQAI